MAKTTHTENNAKTTGTTVSLRERAAGVDPVLLAAGAAIAGAVVGAVVPRSSGETRLLAPLGKHVTAAAGSLGTVARQALSAELAGVPVVGQIAADQIDRVIDSVVPSVATEPEPEDRPSAETAQPALAD